MQLVCSFLHGACTLRAGLGVSRNKSLALGPAAAALQLQHTADALVPGDRICGNAAHGVPKHYFRSVCLRDMLRLLSSCSRRSADTVVGVRGNRIVKSRAVVAMQ